MQNKVNDTAGTASHMGVSSKWLDSVKAAQAEGSERVRFELNRSAFAMGRQIARGKADEKVVALELIAAGVSAGLSKVYAADTVARGISDGKRKELREITEKSRELEAMKESWGVTLEDTVASKSTQELPKAGETPATETAETISAPGKRPTQPEEEVWPVYADSSLRI